MRLLNTTTLQFKEFFDADIGRYAILSHRWEPSDSPLREIEYHELANLTAEERLTFPRFASLFPSSRLSEEENTTTKTATWTNLQQEQRPYDQRGLKIGLFCDMARTHGYDWAWIDTCCIDKRNSAELSEAINSMFRWYQRAARCYVYFNDVEWRDDDGDEESKEKDSVANSESSTSCSLLAACHRHHHHHRRQQEKKLSRLHTQLRSSAWFTRGWTLQELLAPRSVHFYDQNWRLIGDRTSLSPHLSAATGISPAYLHDYNTLQTASVATKMSWASNRKTSRVEDAAYSLLGLFGIHMPMLYGEGRNAFLRLQRKIIKMTDDETIFAWSGGAGAGAAGTSTATSGNVSSGLFRPHGMLAPWPDSFRECAHLVTVTARKQRVDRKPYAMTNKGLELQVCLPRLEVADAENEHQTLILGLNCERTGKIPEGEGRYLAIVLEKFGTGWKRVYCNRPCFYKHVVENTFKVGSRVWPASSLTENTSIYIIEER